MEWTLIGLLTTGILMTGGQIVDAPWKSLTVCYTATTCLIGVDAFLLKDTRGTVGLKLVPYRNANTQRLGDHYYGPFLPFRTDDT